jgi:Asp-tRNA(Asn)/Glu-tRNA(Gln) amidotransferase A subunit family amidase
MINTVFPCPLKFDFLQKKLSPTRCIVSLFVFASLNGCTNKMQKSVVARQPFSVIEATITKVQEGIKNGKCSCADVVSAYLKRIDTYDQPTKLNSIIVTNPAALTEAKALDKEWRKTKKMRPLFCVPVIVKDNYNTAGLQTTAGSLAMKGFVPVKDATMVKKIIDAGAIVLAKSNMAEWAFSPMVTISSIAGETLNPYNLDYVPAGSSGGTAAAVAACFGLVGLGTDTGNSIRGPASHNSLVGFRTTIGLISREGIAPLFLKNDVGGPITRTVEDAAKMLEVLAGYDPADTVTIHSQGKIPANYTQFLDRDGLKGIRIGVLRILSERNPDAQVKALFEKAITDLKNAGAEIIDSIPVPGFDSLRQNQYCAVFQHDINEYLNSLGPAAPVKNLKEIIASGKFAPYIQNNLNSQLKNAVNPGTNTCTDPYHDTKRIAFRNAVEAAMDKYQVAAVIYPTWNNPPAKVNDLAGYKGDNSQIIAPITGQPAFTIPMGFTYNNLPAGLQFLGRMFDEPTLIKLTYAYEQATMHRKPPFIFAALQ